MTIQAPIFGPYTFGETEREAMDRDGHFVFPELLMPLARERLTESLDFIESIRPNAVEGHEPNRFSAEFDAYLESLIGHPQMLALARKVLGEEIRYDHCVALNRPGGNQGTRWHSHGYGEEDPNLGFIRIFFYVNGFEADDGGLKAVPGSHLFRDREIRAPTDEELKSGWMAGKTHPVTGEPLKIEGLSVPPGTVILMWTHAAHGVNPRQDDSETRWTVVYAYRNPGLPSRARWISEAFEKRAIPGAEGLLRLY
ncbi:MAG: phytanoyl-CoA dioxygenase family protein [bacterium]|nr:phytanoyl-CoA dioxygenase family protein [bacterium]